MPTLTIADLRGGRNGIDSPLDPTFPLTQGVEMQNLELSDAPCSAKRGGSTRQLTDVTPPEADITVNLGITACCRWVPSGDEALAELWIIFGNGAVKRYAAGGWHVVAFDDAIFLNSAANIVFVPLNGKLFILYKSGVNRCHCYDPNLAVPVVRRVGINPGTVAPTVANTGAGAYAAVLRYYRVRFIQLDNATSTVLIRRSEPTPSVSFTPSGGGTASRVTIPAVPGEHETHWELEASSDNVNWIVLYGFGVSSVGSAIAIATTTQDDSSAVSAYATRPVSDLAGTYTLFPSAKYGTSDGNRLILAGSYDTVSEPKESRIWLSAVLGTDKGDDERWVNTSTQKNRIDLSEKNGGAITGLSPTINGVFWAGKYRRITRLTPTEDLFKPYLSREVTSRIGFLNHQSIVECEDAAGSPALAFLSFQGLHRISNAGLEYCGRDIEDIWRGLFTYAAAGKINLEASIIASFGSYYADKRQLWLWIATGANSSPNVRIRWDVRQATRKDKYGVRGGFVIDTGDVAAYCACQFANTLGATVSKDLKPYTGRSDTLLYKHDTTDLTDNGTAFQALGRTRCLTLTSDLERFEAANQPIVVGLAQASSLITVKVISDFSLTAAEADILLDPQESESRVIRRVDGVNLGDVSAVQLQFGDTAAMASRWAIDAIVMPTTIDGPR